MDEHEARLAGACNQCGRLDFLEEKLAKRNRTLMSLKVRIREMGIQADKAQVQRDFLEMDVLRLKARLYDLGFGVKE